jgi:hypothetical protein
MTFLICIETEACRRRSNDDEWSTCCTWTRRQLCRLLNLSSCLFFCPPKSYTQLHLPVSIYCFLFAPGRSHHGTIHYVQQSYMLRTYICSRKHRGIEERDEINKGACTRQLIKQRWNGYWYVSVYNSMSVHVTVYITVYIVRNAVQSNQNQPCEFYPRIWMFMDRDTLTVGLLLKKKIIKIKISSFFFVNSEKLELELYKFSSYFVWPTYRWFIYKLS